MGWNFYVLLCLTCLVLCCFFDNSLISFCESKVSPPWDFCNHCWKQHVLGLELVAFALVSFQERAPYLYVIFTFYIIILAYVVYNDSFCESKVSPPWDFCNHCLKQHALGLELVAFALVSFQERALYMYVINTFYIIILVYVVYNDSFCESEVSPQWDFCNHCWKQHVLGLDLVVTCSVQSENGQYNTFMPFLRFTKFHFFYVTHVRHLYVLRQLTCFMLLISWQLLWKWSFSSIRFLQSLLEATHCTCWISFILLIASETGTWKIFMTKCSLLT